MDRLVEYSDQALLEEIRRACALISSPVVTKQAFDRVARTSASTVRRRFGGWHAALQAAGLGDRYSGHAVSQRMRTQASRTLDNDAILAELRRVAASLGVETLRVEDLQRADSEIAPTVVRRRFGSWPAGLRAAGLSLSKHGNRYTDEEFFENLLAVWTYYGRAPRYAEMDRPPSRISAGGYFKRFGTWGKAKLAFVERVNADTRLAGDGVEPRQSESSGSSGRVEPMLRKRVAPEDQRSIRLGLRYEILKRDRFRCVLCGSSPVTDPRCRLHVDHIVAAARGGKTVPENLRTACEACNLGKGAKMEEQA